MHRKEDIRDIRKCPQDEVKSGWSVSVDANRALLTIGNTVPQLTFSTIFVNSTSKEPRLPEPTNTVYYILRICNTISSSSSSSCHCYNVCNTLVDNELLENMADLRIRHQAIEGVYVCVGGWFCVSHTAHTD